MSDIEGEEVEQPNQDDSRDDEIAGSQSVEVDTEPVLPLTSQAELHSSCDTYMSQQSENEEEEQHEDGEGTIDKPVADEADRSAINSSLEVEADDSANNLSETDETRKRKDRSDESAPSPKKSRVDSPVTPAGIDENKQVLELSDEGPKMKQEEGAVLEISYSPDRTIIIDDDSQEFSLRVEDTSPPTQINDEKEKDSHDTESWKSHSKDKLMSPGQNSLSQKSGNSWSSHTAQNLSWSSHMDEKYNTLKKEYEEVRKELESLKNEQSPVNNLLGARDINAECDGKLRVVTDERLCTVQWTIDEKTNKVLLAEIKQISLMEDLLPEKPGRLSITSSTSAKSSSSSGSVGLPGPFTLQKSSRSSIMSSASSSSGSRPAWDGPFLKPPVPGDRLLGQQLACGFCNRIFPPVDRTISPLMNGSPKLSEEEELHLKPSTPRRSRKNQLSDSSPSGTSLEEETMSSENLPQAASTPTPGRPRGRPRRLDKSPRNFEKLKNGAEKTPRNGADKTPKSVKTKTPVHTDTPMPLKSTRKGEPVFARWADGRYYPGWVNQSLGPGQQAQVHFCDGQSKLTPATKVVRADIITSGALVLAATDDDEYEEALVVQVVTDRSEPRYQVERDSVTRDVPFSDIALLETQVLELTVTDAQKAAATISFNDLSLENILSHPRKRAVRALTQINRDSSPTPKKKKRQATPEPSTSHGQTFSGPEEYYMDTDSSTHSGCSLDLRGKEVRPLDVECSPPEVTEISRTKQSLYRRNNTKSKTKKLEEEPEHLVKMLGPIPDAGSDLFAGCVFLITYTTGVELSMLVGGIPTSDESKSSNGTTFQVWKDRLRTQIKNGGGKVYSLLNHVPKEELQHTYLVTDKPCNTPLYLQCLVNNIPIYSVSLIIQCCTQNRTFKEILALRSTKKLAAGYSLAKKGLVNHRNTQPLKGKTVLLALSGEATITTFWESLIKAVGGVSEVYRGGCLEEKRYHVIVTDADCDRDLVTQACEQNVPLVSLTWLQQCIINGDWRNPTEHPLYKYNCTSGGEESPEY